jgi:hypothetical protein
MPGMAEGKLRRVAAFHGDAVMSGGKTGVALAGSVSLVLGGSVGALTVWLAHVSWVIAALVAMASLFFFYAWGAYRIWDGADLRAEEADKKRQEAESALEARSAAATSPSLLNFHMSDDSDLNMTTTAPTVAEGGGMSGRSRFDVQHFPGHPDLFRRAVESDGEQEGTPQAEREPPGEADSNTT